MADSVNRRKAQRRKGPIRSSHDRRVKAPSPAVSTRSGRERRQRDRRSGMERRKAS